MIEDLIAELNRCLAKADKAGEMLAAAHISSALEALKTSVQENAPAPPNVTPLGDLDNQPAAFRLN